MTEGGAGLLPDWYPVIRAAKYLNVPPWELLKQPLFWQQKALIAEMADTKTQEALRQQEEAKAAVNR